VVTGQYQEVVLKADHLVTLIDCAGHEKYLKTTIAGLCSSFVDYALVLVNSASQANAATNMTIHHLRLCAQMNIPVIVLFTKSDRSTSHTFQECKYGVTRLLKSPELNSQRPFLVKTLKDVELVSTKINQLIVPMIEISSVTGDGMDLLKALLAKLHQRRRLAVNQINKPFECLIEEIYQVPGVGTVLSGFVTRGDYQKGHPLYIGPLKDQSIMEIIPKSMHVAQTIVDKVWAGHSVCFDLPKSTLTSTKTRRKVKRTKNLLLRKGMVVQAEPFSLCSKFVADIYLTKNNGSSVTVVNGKFDATLHILNNKQSAKIIDIVTKKEGRKCDVMRQGDSARVVFEVHKGTFLYVRKGMRIIIRCGHVIGQGIVVSPI
jgi:GTPase